MSLSRRPAGQATHQIVLVDYDGGTNPIYIGYAEPGTATSDGLWLIQKLTWDVNNNVTSVLFADGRNEYGSVWDDRAALSYS